MAPIRVLVVDDSVVMRRMVTHVLEAEPDIEVVGFAANGRLGLAKIEQLRPDAVTLDIEMPEMDGLATLPLLRAAHPKHPVLMCSTPPAQGPTATFGDRADEGRGREEGYRTWKVRRSLYHENKK